MLKAMSTYLYVKERLHPGLLDGLVRGGAQAIEIFAARQHIDYANRRQHVREIADWFRTSGVPLHSVHSPMYADYEMGRTGASSVNVTSTDRSQRINAMDEIKRALRTRAFDASLSPRGERVRERGVAAHNEGRENRRGAGR